MLTIPIVVVAYNREYALSRILAAIAKAYYSTKTKLIISIDGGGPESVVQIAEEFSWTYGEKEVIVHGSNLGLRKHVLSCGALSKRYDGIILLEDDLYVSPCFYDYAVQASKFYQGARDVSGIALYSQRYNETAYLPFFPYDDGTDVFFMQLACSWGQIWLQEQWKDFEDWYAGSTSDDLINEQTLPVNVRLWPDTSWKKYFIQYMILNSKYFVYPRQSYTTNFGDKGQHHVGVKTFQVPLAQSVKRSFCFAKIEDAKVKYDAFCEIEPDHLKKMNKNLNQYEFTTDLYGTKESHHFNKSYVLTSKKCTNFTLSFDKTLIPIEANVIESIPGSSFFLAKREDVKVEKNIDSYIFLKANSMEEQKYHYALGDQHFTMRIKGAEFHRTEINEVEKQLDIIMASYSFRIGRAIVRPFSVLKRIAQHFIKNDV